MELAYALIYIPLVSWHALIITPTLTTALSLSVSFLRSSLLYVYCL